MSEKPRKRIQLTQNMLKGVAEIVHLRLKTHRPNYKAVAAKYGLNVNSLKTQVCMYSKGMVDTQAPRSEGEKQSAYMLQDTAVVDLARRVKAMMVLELEHAVKIAELETENGQVKAHTECIPLLKEIEKVTGIIEAQDASIHKRKERNAAAWRIEQDTLPQTPPQVNLEKPEQPRLMTREEMAAEALGITEVMDMEPEASDDAAVSATA